MPDLTPQFSAPSVAPPLVPPPPADDGPTAAAPPEVDPTKWEDFPTFRETFLAYFTTPKHNAALRTVGTLLYDMTLAAWEDWPDQPQGWLRGQLRAAAADLRHLQGFLVTLAETPSADPYEAALQGTAVLTAHEIASAAKRIEKTLGTGRGEQRQ